MYVCVCAMCQIDQRLTIIIEQIVRRGNHRRQRWNSVRSNGNCIERKWCRAVDVDREVAQWGSIRVGSVDVRALG